MKQMNRLIERNIIMQKSEQYRQKVLSYIKKIRRTGKPVVIFGAGRGGWFIMKVLEYYGVSILAFADNDQRKHGMYFNYPVHSPEEIARIFPEAHTFLGILNQNNSIIINKQLQTLDFHNVHNTIDAFLFVYFTAVANRQCDREKLAHSISLLYDNNPDADYFFSPTLSYVITQKCTLRCKDCGAFVPNIKSPITIPIETIVNDIKNYCTAFDVVHHIALQGGEPFIHPDIQRLCREVAAISNLVFVDFVTNGTILPSNDTIRQFSECGNCVLVSDYGPHSTKLMELSNALRNNNVYFEYYRYDSEGWGQQTPIYQRNRGVDVNTKIYKECILHPRLCCQIMNGELHRCSFSNYTSNLGLIPRFEDDFVRLNESNVPDENLKAKIRAFINRDTALNACDYCPANERKLVPAGIQVPKHQEHIYDSSEYCTVC